MGTLVFCGFGAYLLVRTHRSRAAAIITVTLAVGWCLAMSFSRLYVGVQFASDVIAGLLAGVAWVAVCVSALEAAPSTIAHYPAIHTGGPNGT